jgi:hypothetical protein
MMKCLPLAITLAWGLVGCGAGLYGDSITDQGRAPIVPVPNVVDGYGNPAPELQPTPVMPINSNDSSNVPGQREVHAAASEADCYKMLRRFQAEGRDLKLRVEFGTGKLPVRCIFEGPDAEAEYYRDRRYEKPDTEEGGN